MRGLLCSLAVVLVLPAVAPAQDWAGGHTPGWYPTGSHTTIDRSEFPQFPQPPDLPVDGDEAQPVPQRRPVQQARRSPEVGTIESPFTPEPMLESYFPPGVDPDRPCPECFGDADAWIVRKTTELAGTWLPAGDDNIGWTDFGVRTSLAFGALENLTVAPAVQRHFIDGPTRTDLPENLYNAEVEFRWKQQVSLPFWFELAVMPGVYSDFERSNRDAFRMRAQGLAFFAFSYETQVVAGMFYLDRFDIDFLPIVGLIHSPREDIKLNLVFPAPKIARRVRQDAGQEWWAYLSGEFGGGAWAIERVPGVLPAGRRKDQIAYRDWRLIMGLERKAGEGTTMFFEAGYVFNRQLEYKSGRGDFDPDDAAMLRAGVSY